MNTSLAALNGLTILVTRPLGLCDKLCQLIEQAGGTAVRYPAISIEEPLNEQSRTYALQSLARFNIAIFISPSAVDKTFEKIDRLPARLSVAAIGSSTEKCLEQQGIDITIHSDGHDSEALLQHPALQSDQLSNKNIIIFRGEGGRAFLGDVLVSRGANVVYAEMYRRAKPENPTLLSDETLSPIDIVTVSSKEGLSNLYELCENSTILTNIPLLVPGQRCAQLAGKLGFSHILQSENATDSACVQGLLTWAANITP